MTTSLQNTQLKFNIEQDTSALLNNFSDVNEIKLPVKSGEMSETAREGSIFFTQHKCKAISLGF